MDRDASLVARMKQGDERALGSLISRHRDHLQYFIYCKVNNIEDAEDLFMETIEEAYAKIHKYNPTHKFSTWLFTIGRNRTIDFIRRKDRLPKTAPIVTDFSSSDLTPEQAVIHRQEEAWIERRLSRLKEKDRNIIEMWRDGYRYEIIAQNIGVTPQAARVRVHRSLKQISNHSLIRTGEQKH